MNKETYEALKRVLKGYDKVDENFSAELAQDKEDVWNWTKEVAKEYTE